MTDKAVSALTSLTGANTATGDLLYIVDISEAAAADRSKKITVGDIHVSIPNGTNSAPSIAFASDPDTGIFRAGANLLAFAAGGTQAVTVDSSGNVGVGTASELFSRAYTKYIAVTSSGSTALEINAASGSSAYLDLGANGTRALSLESDGTNNSISAIGAKALAFNTNGTERARITSGGYFKASNTGNYSNVAGTYHELRSDANASTARITNIISSGYTDAQLQITFPAYTPNTTAAWFVYCDDSTNQKAGILTTGTFESRTSTYGGVSDAKLKQDIADAASQWDDLKAVRVRKFRFKDEPDSALQIGVVAQELESVSPGLIYETPDYKEVEIIDDEGNTKKERQLTGTTTKSVKYSILYMKAVKALQEAMARIEQLEAKVAALEAK